MDLLLAKHVEQQVVYQHHPLVIAFGVIVIIGLAVIIGLLFKLCREQKHKR